MTNILMLLVISSALAVSVGMGAAFIIEMCLCEIKFKVDRLAGHLVAVTISIFALAFFRVLD